MWKIHLRRIRNFVLCPPGLIAQMEHMSRQRREGPSLPFPPPLPHFFSLAILYPSSLQPNSDPRSMKSLWHYVRDVYKGREVSIREHGSHKRSPPPLRVLIGNKCLVLGLAPRYHFVGQMDVLLVQMLSCHSGSGLEEEE